MITKNRCYPGGKCIHLEVDLNAQKNVQISSIWSFRNDAIRDSIEVQGTWRICMKLSHEAMISQTLSSSVDDVKMIAQMDAQTTVQ